MGWTLGEIEFALALSKQGKSFSEIAQGLNGKTRNSVAGKFKRLGIHQPAKTKEQRGKSSHHSPRAPYSHQNCKNLNHLEDLQDFFSPETFGKGFQ